MRYLEERHILFIAGVVKAQRYFLASEAQIHFKRWLQDMTW